MGRDTEDGEEFVPGQVRGALENQVVTQVSAGNSHTAAVDQNGNVYCWGVFRVSVDLYLMCVCNKRLDQLY